MLNLTKLDDARDALGVVQKAASRINEILVKVDEVVLAGDDGEPVVDLNVEQKDLFKTEYAKAKTKLKEAVSQLP